MPVLIAGIVFIVLAAASTFLPVYVPTRLIITVKGPETVPYRVYYDTGKGYRERKSVTVNYTKSDSFTELAFALPPREITRLRIDPGNTSGTIDVKSIALEKYLSFRHAWGEEEIVRDFRPLKDIGRFGVKDGVVSIESIGDSPQFETTAASFIPAANRVKRVYLYLLSFLLSLLALLVSFKRDTVSSWLSRIPHVRLYFLSIVLIYLALITVPPTYILYNPDLDNSWMYAVNYLYDTGVGNELVWTGGYLEFLLLPVDIGRNLEIALCFQLLIWVIFVSSLIYLLKKETVGVMRIVFFTVLFINFLTISSIEYFSVYTILALFLISFIEKDRWYIPFTIGVLLSVIVFFIKFNNGLLLLSTAVLLVMITTLLDYKKGIRMGIVWLLSFAICFTILYLYRYKDFSHIAYFLRGIYEISSGYSAAMSYTGVTVVLLTAIGLIMFYFLFLISTFIKERRIFFLLLLFSIPLFFAFKHGFVRQDVHSFNFFGMFSGVFSLALLSLEDTQRMTMRSLCLFSLVIILSTVYITDRQGYNHHLDFLKRGIGLRSSYHRIDTLLHPDIMRKEFEESEERLEVLRIPKDWADTIGEEPTGIFPFMLNYAPANHLRYVNFPVFQSYSAYTALLDTINSRFLEDTAKAPRFILMHWDAIDGRHPLTDAPAMWLSIYKWYDVVKEKDDLLLLQRRAQPRFRDLTVTDSRRYSTDNIIVIPHSNHPVILKIPIDLTLYGRIMEVLFRVPEVRVTLLSSSRTCDMRIVPDTLQDGLLVNFLPEGLEETKTLLSYNKSPNEFSLLRLHGEGLRYYKRDIIVEYGMLTDTIIDTTN